LPRTYVDTAAAVATNGAPRRCRTQCRAVAKAAQSTRKQGRECAMAESSGCEKGSGQGGKAQGGPAGEGGVMANVIECIDKLVAAKSILRKVADEALEFFNRSKAEYSTQLHSAGES
jgi:hypothetical protein